MKVAVRLCGLALALGLTAGRLLSPTSESGAEKQTAPAKASLDFVKDVRPILEARCFSCHGPDKQRADLRLDRRDTAWKGGESGPVIVPGKSQESLLLKRVGSTLDKERMPPRGDPLTAAQREVLGAWIDQGAVWPDSASGDPVKTHWAFQPVVRPEVPHSTELGWARNAIDQFVATRLKKAGLRPAPEAERSVLIRRLKFDLLGLPPTPEEVDAFVNDPDPHAYEKLVDRYLASPHFGERWARHWLDAVRFGESHGFEANNLRPNAWPYRDYVIEAYNEDRPYDQFVREQITGDRLGADEATGFLVGGAFDEVKGDPNLSAQQRADELHDIVSTTGSTFLGLTVGCARCHNHKFDPISQVDYYALKAVFAGVRFPEGLGRPGEVRRRKKEVEVIRKELAEVEEQLARLEPLARIDNKPTPTRAPINPRRNVERFAPVEARFVRMTILATVGGTEPCVDELEVFSVSPDVRNVALASNGTRATASGTIAGYEIHKLAHLNDGKYGNSWSWISDRRETGWVQLELPTPMRIDRIVWSRDRGEGTFNDRVPLKYRFEVAVKPNEWQTVATSDDRLPPGSAMPSPIPGLNSDEVAEYRKLLGRQRDLETRWKSLATSLIFAPRFGSAEPTPRLHRGEIGSPKELIAPAAPAAFGDRLTLALDAPEADRRLALAKWITDPKNPLTARVMVNRIWQHHFGAGLVNTPSDFGVNGARPTHPELLDWLASEFIAGGWRMKPLHRLIVLSRTYRQASTSDAKGLLVDAQTRLLWRFPPHRLEAEPLRDAILSVSGKLDLRMGGPGFDPFEPGLVTPQGVRVYVPRKEFGPPEWRRMVYQTKARMRLDDTFGVFDCPDAGQIAPKRTASTTVLQVVSLLNSPFMRQQAQFFAERLRKEAGDDPAAQVRRGFRLAFQRESDAEEASAGVKLVEKYGLNAFCLDLFNVNEFLYVD
jgi:hypothetical protein